mgnify:CR=1 FL=1
MMKIDKTPVPMIVPNPEDPRLTERVAGTDQTGAAVEIRVPVERPLTLYLNAQEIVTMMTIGDYPDYLAVGYLRNQNMLRPDDEVIGIPHRIVIGDKGLERGVLEYKRRRDGLAADVPLAEVAAFLRDQRGNPRP